MKRIPTPTCSFDSFKKEELDELADRLLEDDLIAIEWCVAFMESETFKVGHGRVRAKMSRRLKHWLLTSGQKMRLVGVILDRLVRGDFTEQFKDQLKLALTINRDKVRSAAVQCKQSEKRYIRAYADWVLSRSIPRKPLQAAMK